MNKEFAQLCTPAKLYLVIAIISLIFALFNHFNLIAIAIKLLFALVWTIVLSCLCDKGFSYLAWFLVLFPYFLILLAFLGIYRYNEGFTEGATFSTGGMPGGMPLPHKKNPIGGSAGVRQPFTVGGYSIGGYSEGFKEGAKGRACFKDSTGKQICL